MLLRIVLRIWFLLLLKTNVTLSNGLTSYEVQTPDIDIQSLQNNIKNLINNVPNQIKIETTPAPAYHAHNCPNSEILLKLLSNLLQFLLKHNPDFEQVKYVLPLIKEYLNVSPDGIEKAKINEELKNIEDQLENAHKHALRVSSELNPNEPLKTNIVFKNIPPNINQPNCKGTLERLIQNAYDVYLQLAKYPMCVQNSQQPYDIVSITPAVNYPNKQNTQDFAFDIKFTNPDYFPHSQQASANIDHGTHSSSNIKSVGPSNELLKYLQNPDLIKKYPNIVSLLQNYKPSLVQDKRHLPNEMVTNSNRFMPGFNLKSGQLNSNLMLPQNESPVNPLSVLLNHLQNLPPNSILNTENRPNKADNENQKQPETKVNPNINSLGDLLNINKNLPINYTPNKADSKSHQLSLPHNKLSIPLNLLLTDIGKKLSHNPTLEEIMHLLKNDTNNNQGQTPQNFINIGDNPFMQQKDKLIPSNQDNFPKYSLNPSQNSLVPSQKEITTQSHNLVQRNDELYLLPNLAKSYSNFPSNQNIAPLNVKVNSEPSPNPAVSNTETLLELLKKFTGSESYGDSNKPNTNMNGINQKGMPEYVLSPYKLNSFQNKYPNMIPSVNPPIQKNWLKQPNSVDQNNIPQVNNVVENLINYLKTQNMPSNPIIPNSISATPLNYEPVVSNTVLLPDLQRLAVANLYKLNSPNIAGMIELTYLLKRPKPLIYQPYYYVKYRLPYPTFVHNLHQLLIKKPFLRTNLKKLYQELMTMSNITEISPEMKGVQKDDILKLVSDNGALVKAKIVNGNDEFLNEQLKIIQDLNSNVNPEEILKLNQEQMVIGERTKESDNNKRNIDPDIINSHTVINDTTKFDVK